MLIPIGRFSKMSRLSVKALRLYHQQDLLSPAHIDETTGYRYYSLEQAEQADMIRVLRAVDMPLEDIRTVLEADDSAAALEQLLLHRDRLAQRLRQQEHMLSHLEAIIANRGNTMPYEITITEQEPQLIASLLIHTSLKTIASDISAGFVSLVEGLGRTGVTAMGAPMLLYHHVIDEESDGDIEICIPVNTAIDEDKQLSTRQLEGGSMATTIHRGPYDQITQAYHSLTAWVSEEGFEIADATREIYLNDPRTVAPEELLTRIEFPVYKASS